MSNDVFLGLPRRIQVGPHTFRIIVGPASASEHLTDNDGCAVFSEFRIYLREGQQLQGAVDTLLHEVSHCINHVFGVTDDSTEEQFTAQHSKGQLEVFMRNPRLLNWINKQVRRMRAEAAKD